MYFYIDLFTLAKFEHHITIDAGVVGLSLLLLFLILCLYLVLVTNCLAQLRIPPTLIALNALLLRLEWFYR